MSIDIILSSCLEIEVFVNWGKDPIMKYLRPRVTNHVVLDTKLSYYSS